ncbi:uncharacterized protein (DUF2147 family) [Sphingomonas vulcanisoli]|uniref:Uncharacterized protein (DUF2147 family) n=1 Tax=Sphingomonas vulcanisoli TaxID=1658060 RepID=A0ABX0TVJ8_9SPHN|nr:DUF2147 domain-containing protein [Sphingomonas vulcanisoli]NIJ08412.1 uncharacterized protein (DUF2147 family) [Sphingomonas vulcanisoli]
MIMLMALAAAALSPDAAIGRWKTETKNGIVEVTPCGGSICGKLVGSDGLRANPELRDVNNKDAALRGRKLMGVQILGGFTRASDSWTGGTIYNGEDGGTYKATVTPVDADHLRVKGCIIWPLCKTQTWTRLR